MKYSEVLKEVRKRLGLSQAEIANALSVSFATINRWENDKALPTKLAQKSFHDFCAANSIDLTEYSGNMIRMIDESIILYHGSKSGIKGLIQPVSREFCDFGKGFYMGTEIHQPLTLICNFPKAKLYTLKVNLRGLKTLDIGVGIDWALLVAYNRGKLDSIRGTKLYDKYKDMAYGCDMIIGYIANDRIFVVLDRFFSGAITDIALVNSLCALKLGRQYVAISQKACKQIEVVEEKEVSKNEREELIRVSEAYRIEGIAKAEEICRKYRREGRFFDEILSGGVE